MFLGWSIPSSSALVSLLLLLLLPSLPVPIPSPPFPPPCGWRTNGRTGRWSCRRRRHRVAWSCYDSYFVKAAAPRATASRPSARPSPALFCPPGAHRTLSGRSMKCSTKQGREGEGVRDEMGEEGSSLNMRRPARRAMVPSQHEILR